MLIGSLTLLLVIISQPHPRPLARLPVPLQRQVVGQAAAVVGQRAAPAGHKLSILAGLVCRAAALAAGVQLAATVEQAGRQGTGGV